MIILVADNHYQCENWCRVHRVHHHKVFHLTPDREFRFYGYLIREDENDVVLVGDLSQHNTNRLFDLLVSRGWDGIPSDRFVNQ